MPDITPLELESLRQVFQPLVGLKINWLSIPNQALPGFEPSQIAVIVNTFPTSRCKISCGSTERFDPFRRQAHESHWQ